jgi:hypothetical protein
MLDQAKSLSPDKHSSLFVRKMSDEAKKSFIRSSPADQQNSHCRPPWRIEGLQKKKMNLVEISHFQKKMSQKIKTFGTETEKKLTEL